jgi:hypothetical protein
MYLLLSVVVVPERFYFSGNKDDEVDDGKQSFDHPSEQEFQELENPSSHRLDTFPKQQNQQFGDFQKDRQRGFLIVIPILVAHR